MAKIIAHMATARLERGLCGCSNLVALANRLQVDLTVTEQNGPSRFVPDSVLACPFGTREGEVSAWRRLQKLEIGWVKSHVSVI